MFDADQPVPFTMADVRAAIEPAMFARGERYAASNRVTDLRITNEGHMIAARVRGTSATPYAVTIIVALSRKPQRLIISGSCDCPVGVDCKHVAAALIVALHRRATAPRTQPLPRAEFDRDDDPRIDLWLTELRESVAVAPQAPKPGDERIAYLFDGARHARSREFGIEIVVVRATKAGRLAKIRDATIDSLTNATARAVTPPDSIIGRFMRVFSNTGTQRTQLAEEIARRAIATGRAHFERLENPPLSLGPAESARLAWELASDGSQRPSVVFDRPHRVLLGAVPWYVDTETWLAGPLETGLPGAMLEVLLAAPPLDAAQARRIGETFAQTMPELRLPQPLAVTETVVRVAPVPMLKLRTMTIPGARVHSWYAGSASATTLDIAELTFAYDGIAIDPTSDASEIHRAHGMTTNVYPRSLEAERRAAKRLARYEFVKDPATQRAVSTPALILRLAGDDRRRWLEFAHRAVGELRGEGWLVEIDPSFRHRVIDLARDDAWQTHIDERSDGWFDLAIGLDVDGRRIDLLPLLQELIARTDALGNSATLDALGPDDVYYVSFANGDASLAFPVQRLKAIVGLLIDLHDPNSLQDDGSLRLPGVRAGIVDELEAAMGLRWDVPERVRALAKRLRSFEGIERVAVPSTFRGELRGYQRDGLDWLQFLRAYGFGGILADDMGLGKSVQTLAHLLCEKKARRLTQPALLVVPTSIVHNWRDEAARFAPSLRVLALHGPDRSARFDEIAQHDLVITTYALLVRDAILRERSWYAVILDEAQALKNPQSKAAQVAMGLQAAHRLCLTGTPVENHLGDLWSLFSIALPGALGDRKHFTRVFRTPIEKHGDTSRSAALAERVRPFLLRRTKEHVASDLPEKTEIVQRVELVGAQRDLYEAVRLAMHRRVREEIEQRGLARSQIVILDALLKLRQVCCDPRLLPERLRKAAPSVKLELLLYMLPQMIEEGRRVLLFSQFTSMLDLIEPALRERDISFVKLTGETKQRERVVKSFQQREVPLFLISLKAGGTGLNLTAADTVIHYDPWWNPAVERQATDRAHRIGQTQHVFVYKFIGAGTVEEKIVELQARKAQLAAAIFSPGDAQSARFSAGDIERLFAPLDDA